MDVIVIGAYGSAGVAVADRLADADAVDSLTLVDDGDPGGGLCILRGCMPSKEVLSATGHRYQVRHDERLGEPPEVDLDSVVETKNDHTATFAEHRRAAVHGLTDREGVEFVHGTARFVDDHVVRIEEVDTGPSDAEAAATREDRSGVRELEADYVVVATGSTVNLPDLPGIEDVPVWTSADVLDARDLPDSGVVMGFGYVGLELVPYLAELGVDLTVIEHDERPLDEADPAFGDDLLDIYREEFGVEVLTETSERSVERTEDGGVRLHADRDGEERAIEAEALFAFTGRTPATAGLGLDATALEPGEGWIEDTMQATADERTFVVGDANGKEPILHVAKEQGQVAAENVLRHGRGDELEAYENVHHHVVFSAAGTYPYARVGHSEASAEAAGLEYVAVEREASRDGVFATKQVPRGRAALVVDDSDGTVLGYQGLHYHADAMAKTMQLAVEMGLDVREIPDRAYHPTTPELLDGLVRAASERL